MSDSQEEILNHPLKKQYEATGILSRLFRKILTDLNIGLYQFNRMVQVYLDDPRNGIPKNGKDRSSARGNLQKELFRPAMTFKVFRKGLMLLAPISITFEIRLKWRNNKTTIHQIDIDNNRESIELEYEDPNAPGQSVVLEQDDDDE